MAPKSSPLDRISQSFTAVKEVRRRKSANLPERFSNDEDDQEDVTAPHGKAACMNQSIFSMITAAGSRTNFNARFDDDGSSSDESVNRSPKKVLAALSAPVDDAAGEVHQGAVDPVPEDHLTSAYNLPRTPPAQRRPTKVPEDKRVQKDEATHTSKSPVPLKKVEERPRARKLSDAQVESSVGISVDPEEQIARESLLQGAKDIPDLASHLRDIFGLTSTEQIIREYPCWMMNNVLLQGYMYVTTKHICFYAYLPKRITVATRSGYLNKRGKQNLRYSRQWFILKGDVLSYYNDASDLYFPNGHIDLRYAVSASLVRTARIEASLDFEVVTSLRKYQFRADSAASAKEWVKTLQKIIFQAHVDGDSVKVVLPVRTILDVEPNPVIGLAETVKIRAIDDEETYAIDEYFFSFFKHGQDALRCLQQLTRSTDPTNAQTNTSRPPRSSQTDGSPTRSQPSSQVKSTVRMLSPSRDCSSPRPAGFEQLNHVNKDGLEDLPQPTPTKSAQDRRPALAGSSSLQNIFKAGALPIHKAAGLAGYLKDRSKRMSSVFASGSIGYYEKVSGMWQGGQRHYDESGGQSPAGGHYDGPTSDEETVTKANQSFRSHFALPDSERLTATYFGYLHRVLPLYGKIYLSANHFCFRSLLPGTKTRLVLPLTDVENVEKEKGFRFGYSGLVVVIKGHEELFFEFSKTHPRDDLTVTILRILEESKSSQPPEAASLGDDSEEDLANTEHDTLQAARVGRYDIQPAMQKSRSQSASQTSSEAPSLAFDDPRASILNFKPNESLGVCCLTIGSRGDVQPYIAFCKGLIAQGHRAKIATHREFQSWVESHGIEFGVVEGDPAELMRICVENGMFTYSFLKEASSKFRSWIDELLSSAWTACQWTGGSKTDVLLESPSAMAGIHIAEALSIPYFRSFSMPWTRTRAYPHAFAVPEQKMGGAYNYFSYVMFDNVFWKATASQVNRWRTKELSLPRTNLDKLQPNKVPFLYSYSPAVVPPPLDYSDWIRVTGYWFLDEATNWKPPQELRDFISCARKDGKKLVYVGFGSIVVSDPAALTRTVIRSVLKADVRCILSKGWSDRLDAQDSNAPEVPLPKEILQIKSVPHDWLFHQIDAAAHHGGAGTTGASLRAGLPTIVKPFFGDQFFFGNRVDDLAVGICIKKMNVSTFSRALWEVCNSQRMRKRAQALGETIRSENGVDNAIEAMYRDLEYAKTLIRRKVMGRGQDGVDEAQDDEEEESWTFIGNDSDPELQRQICEWSPAQLAEGRRKERDGRGGLPGSGEASPRLRD